MDIKTMTIVELKSLAYDQLAQLEQTQNNLKLINQEIINKQNTPAMRVPVEKVEKVEEVKKPNKKK